VLLAVPAVVRGWRHARRHAGRDAPATLLEFAVTGLPESHQDWGRAMCAELEPVRGAGRRWGFSLGCARAAGVIRARVTPASRRRGGAGLRAVIGAGLLATLGLAAYGFVRYPGLRSDGDAPIDEFHAALPRGPLGEDTDTSLCTRECPRPNIVGSLALYPRR